MAGNHRHQLSQTDPRLQTKGAKESRPTMMAIEQVADPRLTTYTEMGQKKDVKPKKKKGKKRHRKK